MSKYGRHLKESLARKRVDESGRIRLSRGVTKLALALLVFLSCLGCNLSDSSTTRVLIRVDAPNPPLVSVKGGEFSYSAKGKVHELRLKPRYYELRITLDGCKEYYRALKVPAEPELEITLEKDENYRPSQATEVTNSPEADPKLAKVTSAPAPPKKHILMIVRKTEVYWGKGFDPIGYLASGTTLEYEPETEGAFREVYLFTGEGRYVKKVDTEIVHQAPKRLVRDQDKEIYYALCQAEIDAEDEVYKIEQKLARYDLTESASRSRQMEDKYKLQVINKYKITPLQAWDIAVQGGERKWPDPFH